MSGSMAAANLTCYEAMLVYSWDIVATDLARVEGTHMACGSFFAKIMNHPRKTRKEWSYDGAVRTRDHPEVGGPGLTSQPWIDPGNFVYHLAGLKFLDEAHYNHDFQDWPLCQETWGDILEASLALSWRFPGAGYDELRNKIEMLVHLSSEISSMPRCREFRRNEAPAVKEMMTDDVVNFQARNYGNRYFDAVIVLVKMILSHAGMHADGLAGSLVVRFVGDDIGFLARRNMLRNFRRFSIE